MQTKEELEKLVRKTLNSIVDERLVLSEGNIGFDKDFIVKYSRTRSQESKNVADLYYVDPIEGIIVPYPYIRAYLVFVDPDYYKSLGNSETERINELLSHKHSVDKAWVSEDILVRRKAKFEINDGTYVYYTYGLGHGIPALADNNMEYIGIVKDFLFITPDGKRIEYKHDPLPDTKRNTDAELEPAIHVRMSRKVGDKKCITIDANEYTKGFWAVYVGYVSDVTHPNTEDETCVLDVTNPVESQYSKDGLTKDEALNVVNTYVNIHKQKRYCIDYTKNWANNEQN